jgi:hypothetical protein
MTKNTSTFQSVRQAETRNPNVLHGIARLAIAAPRCIIAVALLAMLGTAIFGIPVTKSHPRDRFARLPHDPDRAFPELSIETSPFHRRSLPSWRCLYGARGSPQHPPTTPSMTRRAVVLQQAIIPALVDGICMR